MVDSKWYRRYSFILLFSAPLLMYSFTVTDFLFSGMSFRKKDNRAPPSPVTGSSWTPDSWNISHVNFSERPSFKNKNLSRRHLNTGSWLCGFSYSNKVILLWTKNHNISFSLCLSHDCAIDKRISQRKLQSCAPNLLVLN